MSELRRTLGLEPTLEGSEALPPPPPAPEPPETTQLPAPAPEVPIAGVQPTPFLKAGGRADIARKKVEGNLNSDAPSNKFDDLMVKALTSGYSYNEVTSGISRIYEKAIGAGYDPKEVTDFFGFDNPERLLFGKKPEAPREYDSEIEMAKATAELLEHGARYIGSGFTHPTDLVSGLEMSSGGMAIRDLLGQQKVAAPIEPTDNSPEALQAQQIGSLMGDAPLMLLGAAGGGVAGSAAGPLGTLAGGGFGAGFLPAWVRSHYVDQLTNGPYADPHEFSLRTTQNLLESFMEGLPGAAAGIAGPIAGSIAGPVARIGVEAATMTAVQSGIQQRLPTMQDFLETGLQVAAMHGVAHIPGAGATIRNNLMRNFIETGETPQAQVEHAINEPQFSQSLIAPPRQPTRPGSSISPAGNEGQFVLNRTAARPSILTTASSMEGKTLTTDARDIQSYLRAGGQNIDPSDTAWCAAFVNSTLEQSGIRGTGSLVATSFDTWGNPVADLGKVQPGDVLVKDRGRLTGEAGGHVGIATGNTRTEGGRLQVEMLSGNEDRMVRRTWENAADIRGRRESEGNIFFTPAQVPEGFLGKIAEIETGGEKVPEAAVSKAGAVGKYQIMPGTATDYGLDKGRLEDPAYNKLAAQTILSDLSKRYQGETDAILIAYNAGKGTADRWVSSGRNNRTLPEETQAYLKKFHSGEQFRPDTLSVAGAARPGFTEETAPEFKPPTEDESESRIGASIKDERVPTKLESFKDWLGQSYRQTLRPDHPLNKIQDLYENGRSLEDLDNPKLLRRAAELSGDFADYGINRAAVDIRGVETGPSFKKIIADLKNPEDAAAFEIYSKARWALEKAAQAKETGVEYLDAQNMVNKYGSRFQSMFDQMVEFRNNSLGFLRDSGIVSRDMYDRWVEDNKSGVPGYRVDDERPRNLPRTTGGLQSRNPVKEMFGSELPTLPVLKTIIQDHFARTSLALRNQHNLAMTQITRELGLSRPADTRLASIELTDAELRNIGADADGEARFYRKVTANLTPNDMIIWRDGKATVEHFDDPLIAEALKGMPAQQMDIVRQLLASANSVFRKGTAYNPLFSIRNVIYDIFQRTLTQGFKQTFGSFYRGVGMASGLRAGEWDRWMKSQGSDYARAYLEQPYIQDVLKGLERQPLGSRVWNAITTPSMWLQAWGRSVMSVMPAGRFAYGVAHGESDLAAGAASSEFKLHRPSYGGPIGKMMNTQVPFLLAHINALEQNIRGALGIGRSVSVVSEGADKSAGRLAFEYHARALAMITAPMLASYFYNRDQDWYKAAPDWQKNNGLLFRVGDATFYVPFPPLVSAIYGGIPRMLIDRYLGGNPDALHHLYETAAGALIPPGAAILGGLTMTGVQILTNHSFLTGRPIVPDDVVRSRLGPEQAVPWSTGIARSTSLFLNHLGINAAPQMIDSAIQGLTGTLGREVVAGADTLFQTGAHAPGSPEATWSDFPGLSSFLSRYPSASAQPTVDFMEKVTNVEQIHGSIEQSLKSGNIDRAISVLQAPGGWLKAFKMSKEGAIEFAQSTTEEDRQRFSDAFNKVLANRSPEQLQTAQDYLSAVKAVGVGREVARLVASNKQMSPSDKRQNIDQAYLNMQAWSEKGLKDLSQLGL